MAFLIKDSEGNVKTHKDQEIYGTENELPESETKAAIKDEEKRIVEVVVSSDRRDRSGDRIIQKGIDSQYANSVLYAHDYGGGFFNGAASVSTIGKILNKRTQKRDGYTVTLEKHQFPPEGQNALADTAWNMITFGALNSTSIGFIPVKVSVPETDEERETMDVGQWGRVFEKVEQLETSWVPVQANREAVMEAISKGIIRDEQIEQFFPTIWKALDEMPKHWFVSWDPEDIELFDVEQDETEEKASGVLDDDEGLVPVIDLNTSDEIIVAINSLKEAVEGLRKDIAGIEVSKGIEETITTDDLDLGEVMSALDDLNGQNGDQIEKAFDQAVDNVLGRLPGYFERAVKNIVNKRLGKVDPNELKFRKVRRL